MKPNVLGVAIDPVTLDGIFSLIHSSVSTNQRALITHVNIRGLNLAYENEWLRDFYSLSDLVYCDGMGVQLGARFLGFDIPHRLTLADWVWPLCEFAEKNRFSFFLLGNAEGTAAEAAAILKNQFPDLVIKGTHHGFFNKSARHSENESVLEMIDACHPNILMVGFGMPIQEKWLSRNWNSLSVNVAITVGGLFEYISGEMRRGPAWMTQNYLEWLVRVFVAPRRYFMRYLRENPLFFWRILKQRIYGLPFGIK